MKDKILTHPEIMIIRVILMTGNFREGNRNIGANKNPWILLSKRRSHRLFYICVIFNCPTRQQMLYH